MSQELSETSRAFLNSYFHLLCKEPAKEQIEAFFRDKSTELISSYTKMSETEVKQEAQIIGKKITDHQQKLKPLFMKKINSFIIGVLVVIAMFVYQFSIPTFIALFFAYLYAMHTRRNYTVETYVILSLEGLGHILKDKFDIEIEDGSREKN